MNKFEFRKLYYAEKVNEMLDVLTNIRGSGILDKSDDGYEVVEDAEGSLYYLLQILNELTQ